MHPACMERLLVAALLLRLIRAQKEEGSPGGETHIQKAVYFLQELMQVPLNFRFILYRYGPYSFELRDALMSLRADGLVRLEPQRSVGAKIVPTERGVRFLDSRQAALGKWMARIEFVAKALGRNGALGLERLGTAYFVTHRATIEATVQDRVKEVRRRKPHITANDAKEAVEWAERITEQAATVR